GLALGMPTLADGLLFIEEFGAFTRDAVNVFWARPGKLLSSEVVDIGRATHAPLVLGPLLYLHVREDGSVHAFDVDRQLAPVFSTLPTLSRFEWSLLALDESI